MTEPTKRYVVTLELSSGNAEVGSMWWVHRICTPETTIADIMAWKAEQRGCHGRLTIAQADEPK